MGFTSAGQSLPGLVEFPYGGSNYTESETWSLPQGAATSSSSELHHRQQLADL